MMTPRVSGLRSGAVVLAFLFLLPLSTAGVRAVPVESDAEIPPDELVTVRGQAIVGTGMLSDRYLDVLLMDGTTLIRLVGEEIQVPIQVGDIVTARGILAKSRSELILTVTSYEVEPGAAGETLDRLLPWTVALGGLIALLGGGVLFWTGTRRLRRRERRIRILVDENPEPIVVTDLQWTVLDANPAACDLFGYKRDRFGMVRLLELLETEADLAPEHVQQMLKMGHSFSFEAALDEPSNRIELVARTRKVKRDDEDCLLTVFHEVTSIKEDHRLFRTFHQRLVENLPIEVAVLSPQGQYLYVNPRMVPEADKRVALLGKTDVDVCQEEGLHPEIALRRRAYRRRAVSTQSVVTFEEALPDSESESRTVMRTYTPVLDKRGNVTAVIMYGMDISELRSYQKQMREVMEEAARVDEMKETFLANISHEFRTPLTGILGFAQILQDEVQEKNRELVDIIIRNGRRLMSTLNSMLDLSRLHSNYLHLNPQVCNMVEEVKEVAQALAEQARQKGLYLRMRATRPEILVRLDRASLYRVLENLIGNAIKFTEKGGVLVEVHGDAENVYVRVMDSGIGIRNEFLPFLFEEFNQESAGSTRDYDGAGIGLAVVKRLIDLMDGTISVDSEKGEGSTFTITFPAAFPQAKDGRPSRSRVLVADDDEEVHTLVEYVLSPYFDVEYAPDFASAMQRAQETHYDVVLLDAELGSSGSATDVLASLRDLKGYEEVPVVALDPHAVHGGEVQYQSAGYDECLQKPLEKKVLLDAMGRLLARAVRRPRHGNDTSPLGGRGGTRVERITSSSETEEERRA